MSAITLDRDRGLGQGELALEKAAAAAATATKTIPKAATRTTDLPEQDWEILVTPGHVRGHRLLELGRALFLPALIVGLVGAYCEYSALTGAFGGAALPTGVVKALTYDPNTYVTVPGGKERATYQLRWLESLSPQQGMTAQQYGDLVTAAASDIRAHGTKADDYVAIPKLSVAPVVTRPEKALTEHLSAMNTGLIAIPHEAPGPTVPVAQIVAWVDGALSWTVVGTTGCVTMFGPSLSNACPHAPPNISTINALKPEGK